ncbi:MAG: hypothetical protein AB8C02_01990 [Halioglobus sp.]
MQRSLSQSLTFSIFIATLFCAALSQASEKSDRIVLSTGKPDSSYWHAGVRLKSVAQGMGLTVETVDSEGSLENLDNLLRADSPVNLTFAQADALQLHLNRYPSDRRKIEILEKIGQQCLFFATALRADFDDVEDVEEGDNIQLGIVSSSSTASLSLEYMQVRGSRFEDVKVVLQDFSDLTSALAKANSGVDALMVLSAPRQYSEDFRYLLDSPHRFRLLDFEGDDLTEELPDGRKIYREVRLALPGVSEPVRTLCVRGLLIANRAKLSSRQRNRLTDLVSYYWMRIYSTSPRS